MTKIKKRKQPKVEAHTQNPWRRAQKFAVIRQSPCGIYTGEIEPGVNFFVLALEHLGAIPHYSCEGHPTGFYVMFQASYVLAQKIQACGYFRVEIEGKNYWSIRMRECVTETDRVAILTGAAKRWAEVLGIKEA
jgi:hypothetical protein